MVTGGGEAGWDTIERKRKPRNPPWNTVLDRDDRELCRTPEDIGGDIDYSRETAPVNRLNSAAGRCMHASSVPAADTPESRDSRNHEGIPEIRWISIFSAVRVRHRRRQSVNKRYMHFIDDRSGTSRKSSRAEIPEIPAGADNRFGKWSTVREFNF